MFKKDNFKRFLFFSGKGKNGKKKEEREREREKRKGARRFPSFDDFFCAVIILNIAWTIFSPWHTFDTTEFAFPQRLNRERIAFLKLNLKKERKKSRYSATWKKRSCIVPVLHMHTCKFQLTLHHDFPFACIAALNLRNSRRTAAVHQPKRHPRLAQV